MPIKRPVTSLITSRYDIKALATIVKFYRFQGVHIPNKSTLPTLIIHDFEKLLVSNNQVTPFDSTKDANDYLDTLGIQVVTSQVKKQYLKQLEIESIISETPKRASQDHTNEDVMNAIHGKIDKTKEGA